MHLIILQGTASFALLLFSPQGPMSRVFLTWVFSGANIYIISSIQAVEPLQGVYSPSQPPCSHGFGPPFQILAAIKGLCHHGYPVSSSTILHVSIALSPTSANVPSNRVCKPTRKKRKKSSVVSDKKEKKASVV